jgi:toxin-antitoxin system PIN domain toxin
MRALLDVNVLIALLDSRHVSHGRAREWFAAEAPRGWASCPITQNGCIRIMSHPNYPNHVPVRAVVERLAEATAGSIHAFWPDTLTLLDPAIADASRIHGPRQITDLYLLALAVKNNGRFVSFDQAIAIDAIQGAQPAHLVLL